MFDSSLVSAMLILGSACAVVYIALMIYRSLIGMREEDQLFIDPS